MTSGGSFTDTHRCIFVETEDEVGLDDHAAQGQAHQEEQHGLSHSGTPRPPAVWSWRHWRLVGVGVHYILTGLTALTHTYNVPSATGGQHRAGLSSRS